MIYICYHSLTGNTKMVAEAIAEAVDGELYEIGKDDYDIESADLIFLGSLDLMGNMSEKAIEFSKSIPDCPTALFLTGGSVNPKYLEIVRNNIKKNFEGKRDIFDDIFICQGKMQERVLEKYEKKLAEGDQGAQARIDNYNEALSHPNEDDLMNAKEWAKNILKIK